MVVESYVQKEDYKMPQRIGNAIKKFFIKNYIFMIMTIPFIMMDFIIRMIGNKISFYPVYRWEPWLFTILFITLFIGISVNIGKRAGKVAYLFFFILSFILFLTNAIYYPLTGFYFSFSLMEMASEGSSYIWDTIIGTPIYIYLIALLVIAVQVVIFIFACKKNAFSGKLKWKNLVAVILFFIVAHIFAPLCFGASNDNLKWNNFKNPRNIYESFSDSNKSMRISGLYEYSVRDFYVTFLKPEEEMSAEDKEFLDSEYAKQDTKEPNKYTGIFEGKNIIFLQLEGMDDWMLTEEATPNLYKLKNEAIDFTDHYSIYSGGGSTYNSEFAVNTGFTTPITYNRNVYTLNGNTFNNSLAKLFKEQGYSVNAFHMNSAEFYNRGLNYRNFGYDNYYGLVDALGYSAEGFNLSSVSDASYELDRTLIENKEFSEKMFEGDKFFDYIITYTPHTPFTPEKGIGKLVAEMKYGEGNIPDDMSEEELVLLEAGETDYFVGLLLDELEKRELLEDTVIVAFADHYLYTIEDKTVLDKYKNTENNLINHTPFFIWGSGIESEKIDKVTMQMSILPTVLNLFGIEYNSCDYLMEDALADDYKGFAFFSDRSWYDGEIYVKLGEVSDIYVDDYVQDDDYINMMNDKIANIIRKNDLTLKYNYHK